MMRALTFDRLGDPLREPDLLSLREVAEPKAGKGEAIVRVALAPINPSDFLFIAGAFPGSVRATPGQVGGLNGAGFVETPAEGGPPAGTLVSFNVLGCWADRLAIPAAALIPLPPDMPLELASQLPNLITAWDLVENSGVQPGGWLALTAGYSTVAVLALQFAARRGIRVLSIVRRRRDDPDLIGLGAEAVIADAGNLGAAVLEATGGQAVGGIIDCVAGPSAGDLIRVCAPFSKMQIYGSLDGRDMHVTGQDILYRGLQIISYGYRFTFQPPSTAEDIALVRRVCDEATNGRLYVPIGGIHPISDYREAFGAADSGAGKRFLRMADG